MKLQFHLRYLAEEENYKILLLLWPVLLCVGLLAIEILSKWLLNEGPPSLIKMLADRM